MNWKKHRIEKKNQCIALRDQALKLRMTIQDDSAIASKLNLNVGTLKEILGEDFIGRTKLNLHQKRKLSELFVKSGTTIKNFCKEVVISVDRMKGILEQKANGQFISDEGAVEDLIPDDEEVRETKYRAIEDYYLLRNARIAAEKNGVPNAGVILKWIGDLHKGADGDYLELNP